MRRSEASASRDTPGGDLCASPGVERSGCKDTAAPALDVNHTVCGDGANSGVAPNGALTT